MSFFGFDATLPENRPAASAQRGIFEAPDPFAEVARATADRSGYNDDDAIDFEDTYDGLGDQLDEANDDFNDDTFGDAAGEQSQPVGKDFDFFGNTAQMTNVLGEEQVLYNLQHGSSDTAARPVLPTLPKRTGYEKYQDPGYIPEIQAKSSVWGTTATQKAKAAPEPAQKEQPAPAPAEPPRKMLSLEEVEAQMRMQAMRPPPQQQQQQQEQSQPPPQHFPGAMLPTGMPPMPFPHQHQPPHHLDGHGHLPAEEFPVAAHGDMPAAMNPKIMELPEEQRNAILMEDAKRAKRNHKIFLLSKGNGLMTPQDKNFITRIQLQQLVTATGNTGDANPESLLTEDFYYQVYSQIRGAPRQHPRQPLGHFAQTYLSQTGGRSGGNMNRKSHYSGDNHMQRMQQQVQRAVEAAKLKPKNKQLILEGSLGKISFSNAKTPKPLLNIKRPESSDGQRPSTAKKTQLSPSDRKSILQNIESVYTILMKMENLERLMPPPPNPEEDDEEAVERQMEWKRKIQSLKEILWENTKVLEPIDSVAATIHPFVAFLSYPKGKKAVPRIFHQIDQEQRITMLTMIIYHLDTLDVVSRAQLQPGESQPPGPVREEIDLFHQAVMPSLLGYVTEAPIHIVIGLLGLVIDKTHVHTVARTKIGLGILTMLLSRAELVKEAGSVPEQELMQWTKVYNRLFDSLEPTLAYIFPGTINSGDDMYVWQFLAAMGIGASPEQQQRLVIAVKDRVMETVAQSKTLPADMASQRLGNVNLFMRAIGLDVELLG
ncbi:topoisomerase II [Arthroderma uncinatum]|uniref:topoisomerase II n=1 Tax=Arthroderma uncinatum TaxID=74035 RepID=UPI00144A4D64|nr:topoisomerase II [Arthroderma uncinatum]KAF3483055.1 topoisomerase II [Arthroderma uncinatum]